jgi:acetyl esterase/lipase
MTGAIVDRRTLIAAGSALAATSALRAAVPPPPGFERALLWPKGVPGAAGVTAIEEEFKRKPESTAEDMVTAHVTQPTLTLLRPRKPNGAALLLIPGGGYVRVAIGLEGYGIARRFADAGYHCFALIYRLPADKWAAGPDAPLQDAQRAMRLIRSRAGELGFDAARVGAIGFSAGGHLGGRLSTVDRAVYDPVDAADAQPFLPQATGLLYPVIDMAGPYAHKGSRDQLLGPAADPARLEAYSVEKHVTPHTPPTFLAAAADDRTVPIENSIAMFQALRAQGVASEMHLFEKGGHGFGLQKPDGSPSPWPDLFLDWAARHGV